MQDYDVLVVGAGLSGVSAAFRLKSEQPKLKFAVLEARDAVGGTWDLFRYPGVRSDSDMYTFGFPFEPWRGEKSVADGEAIRAYVQSTVEKHHLNNHIRFGHRVRKAAWKSREQLWKIQVESESQAEEWCCRFLWLCTGYFKYEHGYQPDLPGLKNFAGEIVHPQNWPQDFDYDREIVVLGSGATAVTLVPELVKRGSRVTMLQRSPSFVAEVPRVDPWVGRLMRFLPRTLAEFLLHWKGVLYQSFVFRLARKHPDFVRRLLLKPLQKMFGKSYVDEHFNPRYNPWEQRLCADTDGDFLKALERRGFELLTDEIKLCQAHGFQLKSGREIPAEVLVMATGLTLQLFGAAELSVDEQAIQGSEHLIYKGCMLSEVPNLFLSLGYTNMSWTLKCDLISRYVCRLLTFMNERGFRSCRPKRGDVEERELIDFSSGYFQRAAHILPKQGNVEPWRLHQSYLRDLLQSKYAPLDDSTLEFA